MRFKLSKKAKRVLWQGVLGLGLVCELVLLALAIKSMLTVGADIEKHIPLWQIITFLVIAVWIYIAYLKQRSLDISKFVVDEKIKTHSLVQQLQEGVMLLDESDRVLMMNGRAAALVGVSELAALGRKVDTLVKVVPTDWLAPGRAGAFEGTAVASGAPLTLRAAHLAENGRDDDHKLIYLFPRQIEAAPAAMAPWTDVQLAAAAEAAEKLATAAPAQLQAAAWRLALDLRGWLYYFRFEQGAGEKAALQRVRINVRLLLEELAQTLRPVAETADVRLEVLHSEPGLEASGDRLWMRCLLLQVLLNAVLCAPKGGRVVVKSAPMGAHAGLAVDDSGETPSAGGIADVFAWPYQGMPGADGRVVRQAGTGLSLARRVAEKHGGVLTAEARAEGGLRVTILLPG